MENSQPAEQKPATAAAPTDTKPTEAKAPEAKPGETRKYANKYDSVEALEKGYNDLYGRLTKTQTSTDAPADQSKATAQTEPVLWKALEAEMVANNGTISDKSVELLGQKMGIPAQIARKFEAFLKADIDTTRKSLQGRLDKDVGDGVTVDEVLQTAEKYLTPAQWELVQKGLDQGLDGGFIDAARLVAKNKKASPMVGSVDQSGKSGYSTAKDIHAATSDNRFGIDRTYTRSVEALINATPSSIVEEWSAFGRKKR